MAVQQDFRGLTRISCYVLRIFPLTQHEIRNIAAMPLGFLKSQYGFDDVFLTTLIGRMDLNQENFTKILDDTEFGDTGPEWMLRKVYDRLNEYLNAGTYS